MSTKRDLLTIALNAVEMRRQGHEAWTHNGITYDLDEGGWCARFVEQLHEDVMGVGEGNWQYRRRTARLVEEAFREAELVQVAQPEPGDVVCLNKQTYWAGHIAIYAGLVDGVRCVVENTSAYRGDPYPPGTKVTPLADVMGPFSGYFQPLGADVKRDTLVVVPVDMAPPHGVVDCKPLWQGDKITVQYAPLLAVLGLPPDNPACHHSTGRAYLRELEQYMEPWGVYYRDTAQGPRVYIKRVAP